MNHGSLFSGIGGFDLAAEWMGWKNVFHCEWNEFGKKILNYYWPNAISYDDITQTDFSIHRGTIDILTGGFPCQPYSQAGKRLGKEDDRHLWPEMLRAIREIQPRFIVGENVYGLTNWNGGLVFEEVQANLEAEGYEVQPVILPAASVGAPHKRDRIWFVAYSDYNGSNGTKNRQSNREGNDGDKTGEIPVKQLARCSSQTTGNAANSTNSRIESLRQEREDSIYGSNSTADAYSSRFENGQLDGSEIQRSDSERRNTTIYNSKAPECRNVADTSFKRCARSEQFGINKEENKGRQTRPYGKASKFYICENWQNFPTQSPVCNGDDGLSARLDSITFPKWRGESIKGGGNAVVPHIPYQIFKVIEQINNKAL